LETAGFCHRPQLYLKKRIEERIEDLAQMFHRWRGRKQWYLEEFNQRWVELSVYFATEREMLRFLGLRTRPAHFQSAGWLSGPPPTRRLRQRRLHQRSQPLRRLIFAYNAFIQNARQTCVERLTEIGELVTQLHFERIKEQVLDLRTAPDEFPMSEWSAHPFLEDFDATFQAFELTDGQPTEVTVPLQAAEPSKRPRWRWAFFRAKRAQLPLIEDEEV